MKRINRFWLMSVCVLSCFLGALNSCHTKPVYAQQDSNYYADGTFYISASVDVDSSYNLSVESFMQVDYDYDEDIDFIELDAYADEDREVFASGEDYGDDYDAAGLAANYSAVPTGHEYGMESDGWVCYDDGEGDCEDYEFVGLTYASVNVVAAGPYIASISPSSVNEGDTGTLTISGSNLVENAADQLSINYSGSGMPFELSGTPSANIASFSYDFSGYSPGTYTIFVTNNEGTSNSKTFTVNPPLNACSQSTVPNAVTLQITQLAGSGGTFTLAHPTAVMGSATTTVDYGPFSTPSSVASSVATARARNYVHLGLTAQSNGSSVTIQSQSLFGSVAVTSPGSTYTV